MEVSFDLKAAFFDREAVIARVGIATAQGLAKGGAKVRLTMRRSIRQRKKGVGVPGSPPFSHSNEPNLKTILYGLDGHSVVIGPVKLNSRRRRDGVTLNDTVPHALETSGTLIVTELKTRKGWIRATDPAARAFPRARRRVRNIPLAARPFAGPALTKVAPTLAEGFRFAGP